MAGLLLIGLRLGPHPISSEAKANQEGETGNNGETVQKRARPTWSPSRPALADEGADTFRGAANSDTRRLGGADKVEETIGKSGGASPSRGSAAAPVALQCADTQGGIIGPIRVAHTPWGEADEAFCHDDAVVYWDSPDVDSLGVDGCWWGPGLLVPWDGSWCLNERLWVGAEYLLWWTQGIDVPPLVTTSPSGADPDEAGVIGEPGTVVLFGGERIGYGAQSGGKFTLGYWLTPCESVGLEAGYLFLGKASTGFRAASPDTPILARPYFDFGSGTEDALLVAHPDFLSGSVAIDGTVDLQAAEVLLRKALFERCCERLDFLIGYRFGWLEDAVSVRQFSRWTEAQGIIPVGTTKDIVDLFATSNQFHGGQLGFAYHERVGRWSLEVLAKLAMGNTRSQVRIDGRTFTSIPGAGSGEFLGGLLAQETNIGTYKDDWFSIMPEVGVTLGFNITCRLRATFGYTFVYWSKVSRAGDQIDRDLSQLPPEPSTGAGRPAFAMRTDDFWAQSMNFGLQYDF